MAEHAGTVRRREDPRLITGAGEFVDDLHVPGCLHAAMLRSPHAHARIRSIDVAAARRLPGVVGVYVAADLGPAGAPMPIYAPHPALPVPCKIMPLARERVHALTIRHPVFLRLMAANALQAQPALGRLGGFAVDSAEVDIRTPPEIRKMIRTDLAKWAKVAQDAGMEKR